MNIQELEAKILAGLDGYDEPLSVMVNKLRDCRFAPGSNAKRFVRQMTSRFMCGDDLDAALTEPQKAYLRGLRHAYRRQISKNTTYSVPPHLQGNTATKNKEIRT